MNLIILNLIFSRVPRGGSSVGWTAVLDTDDFTRGAAEIDQSFDDLSGASSRFDKTMSGMGVATAVSAVVIDRMGQAIIGAFSNGIEMAKQFEQQMAKVRTLIQVTDAEFDNLGKGVLAISQRLPQTLDSLTDALFNLISAGVETKDSLDVLELSAKAATAGFTDVNTTAKLGISTINAFGLEITDLNRVYDIFFETARIGVTNFESLASELGSVLPSAKALGVSLEELGGIFAAATKGGISTAEVATGLDATFRNLAGRKDALEELANVKLFDAGEFRGLVPVFNDLSESLGELTRERRVDLLNELGFDAQASRIVLTITNDMETFNESVIEVAGSAGAMGKAFETAIVTSENQLGILGNRIKTLSMGLLQPFVSLLGDAAGGINRLFDSFDASRITSEFQSLQTSTQDQIRQLEILRQKYEDTTQTLSNTTAGAEAHERASQDQKDAINAIRDILPGAITGYNEYGDAIGVSVGHIKDFIDAQKQMLSADFVDRIKGLAKDAETLESRMADLTESVSDFAGISRSLKGLGREGFIELVKNAELGEEGLERLFETFQKFGADEGEALDLVSEVEGILRNFDNVDDQVKAAGESFDRLGEKARAALVDPNERIREMNKQLGVTKIALDKLTASFGLRGLIEDYRELSEKAELTADETKRLNEIIGEGLALELGANVGDVEKQLQQFAEILGPVEVEILPKVEPIKAGDVAIDPIQFDKVKDKLKIELDEMQLAMLESGDTQEAIDVARARRSVERFTEALSEKVNKEKDFNAALLKVKIELAEAEIKLLESTESERKRIENETTRNQEEAARTRIKLFADEISAQLKLLDGLSGQDKTVAVRVLSEVGGFGEEKIERLLSGVEDGILSAGDVLEVKANLLQEAMNALDQNLDVETKETRAFTDFVIAQQDRISHHIRQAQAERIKEEAAIADSKKDTMIDMADHEAEIDERVRKEGQAGREAEAKGIEEQTRKGMSSWKKYTQAQKDNAIQQNKFLRDTNQISLWEYRQLLFSQLDALEDAKQRGTEIWREAFRELHDINQQIAEDFDQTTERMAERWEALASGLSKTFDMLADQFGEKWRDAANLMGDLSQAGAQALIGNHIPAINSLISAASSYGEVWKDITGFMVGDTESDEEFFKAAEHSERLSDALSRLIKLPQALLNEFVSRGFTDWAGQSALEFLEGLEQGIRDQQQSVLSASQDLVGMFEKGIIEGFSASEIGEDITASLDRMMIRAIIESVTNLSKIQPLIGHYAEALVHALSDGILDEGEKSTLNAYRKLIEDKSTKAFALQQQAIEQVKRDFGIEFEGSSASAGGVDRLTPRTSFTAVTERTGSAMLSSLTQQTRHLFSIRESGLRMVEILNRQKTTGDVPPAAAAPLAPPAVQHLNVTDTVNIQIDGEFVMEANGIDDVDVELIAARLHQRIIRRREAFIGRARG